MIPEHPSPLYRATATVDKWGVATLTLATPRRTVFACKTSTERDEQGYLVPSGDPLSWAEFLPKQRWARNRLLSALALSEVGDS